MSNRSDTWWHSIALKELFCLRSLMVVDYPKCIARELRYLRNIQAWAALFNLSSAASANQQSLYMFASLNLT